MQAMLVVGLVGSGKGSGLGPLADPRFSVWVSRYRLEPQVTKIMIMISVDGIDGG